MSGGEAGLHLVMWSPDQVRDVTVAQRAAALGLGARCPPTPGRRCAATALVLGYGNLDEGNVGEAVRRLKRAPDDRP